MFAWLTLLWIGCGPPSSPPVGLSVSLEQGTAPEMLAASVSLDDASGGKTIAGGTLVMEVKDRAATDTLGTGSTVCNGRAEVPASAFREVGTDFWSARSDVRFGVCPTMPPNVRRELFSTFTPAGASALPVHRHSIIPSMFPWLFGPGDHTPPVVAPPPAPPPAVAGLMAIDPWPVAITAPGATLGPDPDATPAFPDGKIVRTATCSVSVKRMPILVAGGGSIRTRLASDGATFSVDEVTADHWRLEFQLSETRLGVSYGVVVGEWGYLCRGEYPSAAERSCASTICSSLRSTGVAAPSAVPSPATEWAPFGDTNP